MTTRGRGGVKFSKTGWRNMWTAPRPGKIKSWIWVLGVWESNWPQSPQGEARSLRNKEATEVKLKNQLQLLTQFELSFARYKFGTHALKTQSPVRVNIVTTSASSFGRQADDHYQCILDGGVNIYIYRHICICQNIGKMWTLQWKPKMFLIGTLNAK